MPSDPITAPVVPLPIARGTSENDDPTGRLIAEAAKDRAHNYGPKYARAAAPTSPLAKLSGNKKPDETELAWLKDRSKCNQFVGDALTMAGYEMPTFKMENGSLHYMNAEKLPGQTKHFEKVTDLTDVRSGDIVVIDYPTPGENGAHVEIVTDINLKTRSLVSVGAHKNGAYESNQSHWLPTRVEADANGGFPLGGKEIYFLRPIKTLGTAAA